MGLSAGCFGIQDSGVELLEASVGRPSGQQQLHKQGHIKIILTWVCRLPNRFRQSSKQASPKERGKSYTPKEPGQGGSRLPQRAY